MQLNIEKSIKILKWKPKYSITQSIRTTTEWYKKVIDNDYSPEDITKRQILNFMNDVK